jgi:Rrf2 family protein
MKVSSKANSGLRTVTAIARIQLRDPSRAVPTPLLAELEQVSVSYLNPILGQLRNSGLVRSRRGRAGGWSLLRRANEITAADVVRSLDGPLATLERASTSELHRGETVEPVVALWLAVEDTLTSLLESVTIADLARSAAPLNA